MAMPTPNPYKWLCLLWQVLGELVDLGVATCIAPEHSGTPAPLYPYTPIPLPLPLPLPLTLALTLTLTLAPTLTLTVT